MLIAIHNTLSKVVVSTQDEIDWLRSYLTIKTKTYRRGSNGVVSLMNVLTSNFPTGFLPKIHQAAHDENISIEYHDKRVLPESARTDLTKVDVSWLRDYQLAAAQSVWNPLHPISGDPTNLGRGILWLPTGAGKTEIAVALALMYPVKWLFLVHRSNLMDQAAERFEKRTGETAGRIVQGRWEPARFTSATFQSVHSALSNRERLIWLQAIEGVIFDEGHTLPAATFYRVAMNLKNAFFRVAMSGTPLARGDKRSAYTIGATGPVLYRIKPEVLIQAGVLSRPTIRLFPVEQTSECPTWQGVYGECVVRSTRRNNKLVEMTRRAQKPCLLFVKELKHGKLLEQMVRKAGMSSEFVWGSKALEVRKAAIKRLVHGDVDVLVASVIFNEGVDIPELLSVVIGSGGKSVIAALQRIGRGMRVDRATGKTTFEVWDIQDKGNKWLEKHTKQRMRAYLGEGYETIIES